MIHVIIPVLDELTYEKYQKTERNYCPSQKFFSMLRKGLCSVRDDLIFYSYIDKIKSKYISKDTQINYVEFSKKTERASAVKKMMELVILKAKRDDVIIADCNDYLCVCAALKVRKKIGCKVIGVITDFPQHVYSYSADRIHDNKFIRILKVINAYRKLLYIKEPDAFVLLTEAMTDIVGKKKPYVVVEGFCDTEKVNLKVLKKKEKNIVYLGTLNNQSGIMRFIKIFNELKPEGCRLSIYGKGEYIDNIKRYQKNNPNIKYCGIVTFEEAIKIEQNAYILINPRPSEEEFNKYSFPSKMLEYMTSGTAILSTRLAGIPNQYYDFLFELDDSSDESYKNSIQQCLNTNGDQIYILGLNAMNFVKTEKNNVKQSKKIIQLIGELK